jgi:hypothetical protein
MLRSEEGGGPTYQHKFSSLQIGGGWRQRINAPGPMKIIKQYIYFFEKKTTKKTDRVYTHLSWELQRVPLYRDCDRWDNRPVDSDLGPRPRTPTRTEAESKPPPTNLSL